MKRAFLFEVFPLVALFVLPAFAHAGVFSSLFGFFTGEQSHATHIQATHNIQTTPLLKAAVHSDPNPSKGGGNIIVDGNALVPETGPTGSNSTVEPLSSASGQISIYTVKPEGDTLSQIADMFDVSVNTIMWANDIKDADLIRPGDELIILPITGVRHLVKEGDTLRKIAVKYNGEDIEVDDAVADIISFNNLASADDIAPGETIVIPGGAITPPEPAKQPASSYAQTTPSAGSSATAGGFFARPARGAITQGLHGYNGVDFDGRVGDPIYAAAAGDVILSRVGSWNGGYGNYIVIRHANGTQTLYAHNASNAVSVGDRVDKGQVIGSIGSTGRSTGSHLHFEVRGATNPF